MSNEHADYLRGCFNDFSCAFNKDRHLAAAKALDALTTERDELLSENIALKNGYKVATAAIAGAMRIALLWRPGEAWRGMHEEEGMALESMYQSFAALTANGEGE